jgi:hypothetical protein
MMTRQQERELRQLIRHGGRLTLPGRDGPLFCTCTLPDAAFVAVRVYQGRHAPHTVNGHGRDVYPRIAEYLDAHVTDLAMPADAPALEVAHG